MAASPYPSAACIVCILSPSASCCSLQLAVCILIGVGGDVWPLIQPALACGVVVAPAGTRLLAGLLGGPDITPRTLKQSPVLSAGGAQGQGYRCGGNGQNADCGNQCQSLHNQCQMCVQSQMLTRNDPAPQSTIIKKQNSVVVSHRTVLTHILTNSQFRTISN